MNKEEKFILRKAVESNEGQISPATMIHGYASGNQGIVERLVSQGYLERVYQFREGIRQATYSVIFYAVTERGLMVFAHPVRRAWFWFKNNITLVVGVFSIFVGAVSILFTGAGYFRSLQEDEILNRPYYFIENAEILPHESEEYPFKVLLTFENTGRTPALITDLKWGFTQKRGQELRGAETVLIANPNSENKALIFLSDENVESIMQQTNNHLLFRMVYADIYKVEYCTEWEYSVAELGQDYVLASEEIRECPRAIEFLK